LDNRFAEMVRAIQLQLKDASLSSKDDVVILCSTNNYRPLIEAYFAAVIGLGADPTLLMHTAPPRFGGLSEVTVQVAAQADVVIDLSLKSRIYHAFHARFVEALAKLDRWFRSQEDPNSYQFAHINLGLDPRIRLEQLDNIAVHFNYGATVIAFGTNYTPLFGSGVRAKSHIDMNLTGADYWCDDLCLVRGGGSRDRS